MMSRTHTNSALRHDLTNKLEDFLKAELINDKEALEKVMTIIDEIRVDFASFDDEIPPLGRIFFII